MYIFLSSCVDFISQFKAFEMIIDFSGLILLVFLTDKEYKNEEPTWPFL